MALSHILQPKSTLLICRLRFSAAGTRCSSSLCSSADCDNPPQLKKEAVEEETRIVAAEPFVKESSEMKPGLFSKATFLRNEVAAHGGSNKAKRLADLFREHKDDQTATMAENEGTKFDKAVSAVLRNFAEYRNTQFEHLSHSYDPLPSRPAGNRLDGHLKELPPNKCENYLPEYQDVRYERSEMSSPSISSQKVLDLKDCYTNSAFDQAAGKIVKPGIHEFADQPFERPNEPNSEDAEKLSSIKGVIDFIRLQDLPSDATNRCINSGLIRESSLNASLERPDNDRLASQNFPSENYRIEDEETSILDLKSIDNTEFKPSMEVSVPTTNDNLKRLETTCFARTKPEENKVLVRFLRRHVTEEHIIQHFSSCGEILKVEFPFAEGPMFKYAHIYFKTREGLNNALQISGLIICDGAVTVESATSTERRTVEIPIPSLIGDPNIPAGLVKNPTRTIKIEQLTSEISSCHIEEALAFCDSNMSGYFLASSPSVAYVEFETEIGKERALAKQSISIFGRHLVMLRIDSPRTTVVRISNIYSLPLKSILSVCRSLGDIRKSIPRSPDIVDVHFGLAEWPKMLMILNRLNGLKVEGRQLRAEPAPVFPPDVLLALWHRPEERKHLKATMQALLHKLGEKALDMSELASIENIILDQI